VIVPPGEASDGDKTGGIDQHEMADEKMMRIEINAHTEKAPRTDDNFKVSERVSLDLVDFTRVPTTFRRPHKGTRFTDKGFDASP